MCERKSSSLLGIHSSPCHLPCRAFRHGGIVRGLPGSRFQPRISQSHRGSSRQHRWSPQHARTEWGAFVTSDSQLGAESRTNLKELWRAALGELQLAMPKANYDTWFKETYVVSEEDDVFCIGVPNAFAREWLDNKYRSQ